MHGGERNRTGEFSGGGSHGAVDIVRDKGARIRSGIRGVVEQWAAQEQDGRMAARIFPGISDAGVPSFGVFEFAEAQMYFATQLGRPASARLGTSARRVACPPECSYPGATRMPSRYAAIKALSTRCTIASFSPQVAQNIALVGYLCDGYAADLARGGFFAAQTSASSMGNGASVSSPPILTLWAGDEVLGVTPGRNPFAGILRLEAIVRVHTGGGCSGDVESAH
ncbi:hypothetical protein B0H15DRAFT_958555 [Mycena belliarum]|uniref:Uncharacterized protein n=1 Tax=Mycena belliarum TaxID=1033014 RepID=A0AAD6TMR8_9AGAR|nr:hypothetical protein B0H15DRAFT_958555 [Mycena belliae]